MAWTDVEPLLHDDPAEVRNAVRAVLDSWGAKQRRRTVNELINHLGRDLHSFTYRLLAAGSIEAHRLGLELVALEPARDTRMVRAVMPILRNRHVSSAARFAATESLVRRLDPAGSNATGLIRSFVVGMGRRRISERLELFVEAFGHVPAWQEIVADLTDLDKMRCPRCGVQRRRKQMRQHLWNRHQLLLENQRARTPAQALDDRLIDADPETALTDFHRDLLAEGLRDAEALDQLCREATERHESICPGCHSFVPVSEPPTPRPAELAPGRLAADDTRVTLAEQRGQIRLRVEGERVIFNGPEPGKKSRAAKSPLLATACAMLAVPAALWLPTPWHFVTAAALVGEAAVWLAWTQQRGRHSFAAADRVIDHAWKRLIPELPAGPTMARIALASMGRGDVNARADVLSHALATSDAAVAIGATHASVAAALWALQFADTERRGKDAVPALVERINTCFAGEMPLATANYALGWLPLNRATTGRLQAMLAERAFAAGLGVWDLVELGRAFPSFGTALGADDLDGLARRRLVWFDRTERPWAKHGATSTAFDIARQPEFARAAFAAVPDMLLYHPLPIIDAGDRDALVPCGRGLVFRGAVLRSKPDKMKVRRREEWRGGGWELRLGPNRFRFANDPTPVADRLQMWAGYWFDEFLPRVDAALKYRASGRLYHLMTPYLTSCPNCGRRVIPVAGNVAAEPTVM